jgi:2-amino-4-hydroxy-6-hydroxymethyldihydropteridine diphosphokinase
MGDLRGTHQVTDSPIHQFSVAIALGSNLGDRNANLEFARTQLRALLTGYHASSDYETEPVGVPGPQPLFLNAAVIGETTLGPRALLDALLEIEWQAGRTRPVPGAARTLDLDLILHGAEVVKEPDLTVPHPRFRERQFVLEPLAEIAPELTDPVTGRTVRELLQNLRALRE